MKFCYSPSHGIRRERSYGIHPRSEGGSIEAGREGYTRGCALVSRAQDEVGSILTEQCRWGCVRQEGGAGRYRKAGDDDAGGTPSSDITGHRSQLTKAGSSTL
jgi:hypothetical protein